MKLFRIAENWVTAANLAAIKLKPLACIGSSQFAAKSVHNGAANLKRAQLTDERLL